MEEYFKGVKIGSLKVGDEILTNTGKAKKIAGFIRVNQKEMKKHDIVFFEDEEPLLVRVDEYILKRVDALDLFCELTKQFAEVAFKKINESKS